MSNFLLTEKENRLANDFLKATTKFLEFTLDKKHMTLENAKIDQDDIWELSKMLVKMSQGSKSFAKFYNSDQARKERNGK